MIIDLIGDDNIVFSTDYPHGDSDFPHAVEEFLEMDGVSNESRKKDSLGQLRAAVWAGVNERRYRAHCEEYSPQRRRVRRGRDNLRCCI